MIYINKLLKKGKKLRMRISVIIPSYNRAHILEKTIPTYFQPGVEEVLLIDDCSTDNTKKVAEKLKKIFPKLKYYRMEKNSKQTGAKNKGIELADKNNEYIYFGDDDALLMENSIKFLTETMKKYNADLVGAKALYFKNKKELRNIDKFIKKFKKITNKKIVDFNKLYFNFEKETEIPVEIPVTHAYFLIKKEAIGEVRFSLDYKGNCFREETDFILQIYKQGKKIMYDSRAIGINLPRIEASGGAHLKGIIGKIKWNYSAIKNNNIFIEKHYEYLKENKLVKRSKINLKILFVFQQINIILKSQIKKIINIIKIGSF